MDCSTPGLPVHHQLLELAQIHVHCARDAIQPSHPLLSPSLPAFSLSQHQGLFKWVSSSHQVAKVLEFQLQHPSFQWIFRTDFLQDWLVGSFSLAQHLCIMTIYDVSWMYFDIKNKKQQNNRKCTQCCCSSIFTWVEGKSSMNYEIDRKDIL